MSFLDLESDAQGELRLARIAYALTQEAIEVEQSRSAERVDVVLVVEEVEHLEFRDDLHAVPEMEGACQAEIESEERIVFAQRIAALIHAVYKARFGGNGLRGVRLHADVAGEAPGQFT